MLRNLEQESNFVGCIALGTLMFRHVNKGPSTSKTAIERVSFDVIYFFTNFVFF